jgi:rRNA 2''-O-methyltransferase fibrillarin (EC 2.1.1.-)
MSDLPEGVRRRRFGDRERLATRGEPVYGEPVDAAGWRVWDINRSKVGALLHTHGDPGFDPTDRVLYLGAATGTTVSHLADMGMVIYAVELSPHVADALLAVSASRPRLFPIIADARQPSRYTGTIEGGLSWLIQDVASAQQVQVAMENRRFLADDGRAIVFIKARSIDATAAPASVFESVEAELRDTYAIIDRVEMDRTHQDHRAIIARVR